MSGSKSTTLSEKVEASLDDAMANFKLLKKEMGAEFRRKTAKLESEKILLEAEKEELDAAKLELEADRAEFESMKDSASNSSPDPKLESEKAALKLEKMELEAEKKKLKAAEAQLGKERAVLESEKTQLRLGQFKLKAAQSQLDDAKTELESAQSQLEGTRAELEIARANLEAALADTVLNSKKLAAAKASLEVAKTRFAAATKQLNAAKSRFESAKVLLDATLAEETSDRTSDNKTTTAAELEIKVLELETEKSKLETKISSLEDDKLSLGRELNQSRAEVEVLSEKLKEVEKPKRNGNPRVFLDIAIKGRAAGRIEIELDVKTTPKTCENFRALCTGEKGIGQSGKPLHYKGTKFNYIDPTQMLCMGGDNVNENGTYGETIYGLTFPLENFIKKHSGSGVVSMASANAQICRGSQFFITTGKYERGDGRNVAFGDVVEGMDVVEAIMKTNNGDSVIADCGQLY